MIFLKKLNMKKIINIIVIAVVMFFTLTQPSIASELETFKVFLSMDKVKFYSNESVMVKTFVKNPTGRMLSFKIFDSLNSLDIYNNPLGDVSDFTSFQPMVYDMQGHNAELIVPYVIEGEKKDEVLSKMKSRSIVLGPGETFIYNQDLTKIYNLEKDKEYRIKTYFFPDGEDEKNPFIVSSNELIFSVSLEPQYIEKSKEAFNIKLQPSEVVLLVLSAEKENDWDRAIKYIDLDQFINTYPKYSKDYNRADDYDKKRIENEFVRYLKSTRQDYLIDFRIMNQNIEESGLISYVEVAAKRKKSDAYKYRYKLQRKNKESSFWLITGLEASVTKDKIK